MTDQCAMHRWMIVKYVVVYALRMQMCGFGAIRVHERVIQHNFAANNRKLHHENCTFASMHAQQSTHWPLFDRSIDSVFWLFRLFATHSQSTTGWRPFLFFVVVVVFVSRLQRCLHIYRTIRCGLDSRTHRNSIDFIFHFFFVVAFFCNRIVNHTQLRPHFQMFFRLSNKSAGNSRAEQMPAESKIIVSLARFSHCVKQLLGMKANRSASCRLRDKCDC